MGHLNPAPVELEYEDYFYIDLFESLSVFRTNGFNGPEPIQPQTIKGWCELFNITLSDLEIKTLIYMNVAFLNSWYKVNEEHKEPPPERRYD